MPNKEAISSQNDVERLEIREQTKSKSEAKWKYKVRCVCARVCAPAWGGGIFHKMQVCEHLSPGGSAKPAYGGKGCECGLRGAAFHGGGTSWPGEPSASLYKLTAGPASSTCDPGRDRVL